VAVASSVNEEVLDIWRPYIYERILPIEAEQIALGSAMVECDRNQRDRTRTFSRWTRLLPINCLAADFHGHINYINKRWEISIAQRKISDPDWIEASEREEARFLAAWIEQDQNARGLIGVYRYE
jgi:hypothetical protein